MQLASNWMTCALFRQRDVVCGPIHKEDVIILGKNVIPVGIGVECSERGTILVVRYDRNSAPSHQQTQHRLHSGMHEGSFMIEHS